jgi:hypothetical protein
MSEDDWRKWKNGKYDNRYHGVKRHSGQRNYRIIITIILIVLFFIILSLIHFIYGDSLFKIIFSNIQKIIEIIKNEIMKI